MLKPVALALGVAALAAPMAHGAARSAPFITEHSAGQNTNGRPGAAGKYGPLDPAIAAAIRSHSLGQNGALKSAAAVDPAIAAAIRSHLGQNGASKIAAASMPTVTPNGFDWGDAGVGAGFAVAAALLALCIARLIPRRGRARLAGSLRACGKEE